MLTARRPSVPLTPIGGDPDNAFTDAGGEAVWGSLAAAAEAGTITNVYVTLTGSGTIAFFTMSASRVVRAISANISAVAGNTNHTVSLAVQPGDLLGIWCDVNGSPMPKMGNSIPTGTVTAASQASKPNVSDTLAAGSTIGTNRRLGVLGTGTT